MQELSTISQYDLYFFAPDAAKAIVKEEGLLGPMVAPVLGTGWAAQIVADVPTYRSAVEHYIRESMETTAVLRTVEQLAQSVSLWRELATGLARQAPAARRSVLLQAAGYGAGTARSPKEMKDLLLTLKSRVVVHAEEFKGLGMSPALLELPGRVLAKLEGGAGDVAREKAEDSLARANVAELHGRVTTALEAGWRAAELVSMQALLLGGRDDAPAAEVSAQQELASRAGALSVFLDKVLGEAKVEARKRAATEPLPPGLVTPAQEARPEQPAA